MKRGLLLLLLVGCGGSPGVPAIAQAIAPPEEPAPAPPVAVVDAGPLEVVDAGAPDAVDAGAPDAGPTEANPGFTGTWVGGVAWYTDGGVFQSGRVVTLQVNVLRTRVTLGGGQFACPTDLGASTIPATVGDDPDVVTWDATPGAAKGCATGPWSGCDVGVLYFSHVEGTLETNQLVIRGEGTVYGCEHIEPASVVFVGQQQH